MIRLIISVIYIFLSACAHRQELPHDVQARSEQCVTKNVPCPPKRLADRTDVSKKYGCDKKRDLPFVIIERQYTIPSPPQSGREFEHHFVYEACVSDGQSSFNGTLTRQISHKKKSVFESKNDAFEIKPGKWDHTAKIKTPPGITPGKYLFQTIITIPNNAHNIKITHKLPFTIKQ